ncbi:cytochrome c biogenesis CcdA family protein [Leucobacter komagatae]|uniref:Cytochrome C biogenesis protein n=1 Tax=Leucobacter komagatae TaxID=55969 RepID=A0A0D0IQH9_9MICO|nr:cytochrome c biogenesis CcdA family protein [Leucobacter komagatae]KIP51753.1 cytochrome C biogenesis protein [Leucobacter komagatae]
MNIGFVTAFLGGVLALLSPCSALLLPAFFASTVGAKLKLLVHGAVFYLGLVVTLVPFGLGVGALGSLFIEQRGLIIALTSVLLVVLGTLQALGFGFDLSRVLPGATAVQRRASGRKGLVRTFLLGAVGGVAGFCAGPILGAVLTLALGQGSSLMAGALLAVYGAGMVVPLVVIAALWERIGQRGQRLLRGRAITVFGRQLHTTSLATGLLIIGVGLLFWFTNGLVSLPSLVPTSVLAWAQEQGAVFASPVFDVLGILGVTAAALWVWVAARRKRARQRTEQLVSQGAK